MNRQYRHVWSKHQGRYVVASETATSHRGGAATLSQAVLAALAVLAAPGAFAQMTVAPNSGKTEVYRAPNGVQIVNIDTANRAGLSHNRFLDYNVEKTGVVLNNANSSQMTRNSVLAGQVTANMNLASEAKVILNEVVSNNRSVLRGFTEVLGGKADVVIANPWGITCNGCGYINTDRAVLTTGMPVIGAQGTLDAFRVTGGDILVTGAGMDATGTRVIDLVARSVMVDARLGATDLGVTTGTNQWDWATRTATAITPDANTPLFALDSTALGGMYANRIRIVATEAGVGVRMLGEAAASADNFSLDAAGRIQLLGRVSAAQDLAVRQTQQSGADAITVAGANTSVTAGNDLLLASADGGITLSDAMLTASKQLDVSARSLTDSATNTTANTRTAGTAVNLTVAGTASLDGTRWSSGSRMRLDTGDLKVGASGATLATGADTSASDRSLIVTANKGDIDLAGASVTSAAYATLNARQGAIHTGSGSNQQLAAAGELRLQAATQIANEGKVASNGNLVLRANDAQRTLAVVNAGMLQTDTLLDIGGTQDLNTGATAANVSLDNQASGVLSAMGALSVHGTDVTNAGVLQARGDLRVQLAGAMVNAETGKLLAEGTATAFTLSAASLANAGALQSKGTLAIKADGAITQTATGQTLTLTAAQGGSDGSLSLLATDVTNQGAVSSASTLNISARNALNNQNQIQADGGLSLLATDVTNRGAISSASTLNISAGNTLNNQNQIQADGGLSLLATDVTNQGAISSASTLNISAGNALNNQNQIQADGDITLAAHSVTQGADGTLLGGHDVVIATSALDNAGRVQAAEQLTIGSAGARTAIVNRSGAVLLAQNLLASATDLSNAGTVQADTSSTLDVAGALGNAVGAELIASHDANAADSVMHVAGALTNDGALSAAGGLDVSAGSLTNSAGIAVNGGLNLAVDAAFINNGTLQSGGATKARVGSLRNASGAKLIAGGDLSVTGNAAVFDAQNAGLVQAAKALSIGEASHRAALANQTGGVLRGDSFALAGTTVVNAAGARMQWNKDGVLNADSLSNAASDSVIIGSLGDGSAATYTSTYNIAGTLDNAGAIHSNGNAVMNAGAIFNSNTAGISALNDLSATASRASNGAREALRNEGAFYAGRNLALSAAAGTAINAGITGTLDADGDITVNARDIVNQNSVRAANITLKATNSFLNQPAGGLPTIYLDESSPMGVDGPNSIKSAEYNCNIFGAACDGFTLFEAGVTYREKLSSALPDAKPQILAAHTLTVNYGAGGGANQAGILSAQTINIAGSGSFVNQDFHLDEITYATRYTRVEIDCTFCSADYTDYFPVNDAQFNQAPNNNDDTILWGSAGAWSTANNGYRQERGRTTYSTSGAGIFAVNINFSGGTLINRGSPKAAAAQSSGASGTAGDNSGLSLAGGASRDNPTPPTPPTPPTGPAGPTPPTPADPVPPFPVPIVPPTNPNGYFVLSKAPDAKYLIETNPLFQVGSDFVGSDYMEARLGINPDTIATRLGDANYEAQLVRQQLIAQTGRNLLVQAESEATQMQRLMDNGMAAASSSGLVYGQTPSPEQLAGLTTDIVWMVETEVAGQKVLAPVVYLAPTTREALVDGAVIEGTNTNIAATSLENTGGTIGGADTLNIATQGDITNTSGTLKGGNVSLTSTEGSIVNKTSAQTHGDSLSASTDIGKTAGIQATGSLAMDAKKDITVLGADVSAGKDATLAAGGNVTFDTIVDKTAASKSSSTDLGLLSKSMSNETTTTEKNIGSNLNVGGNLAIKSGGDTTIAGSAVKAGGNVDVDAGGSLNVLARQDTSTTSKETSQSGLGVGGGLYGSQKTTSESFDGKNVGSSIQAGGNADIKAGKDMVVQGSDVKVAGNADIKATDGIKILDGLDEHRETSRTETTTFLSTGGSAAAEANAQAQNGSGRSAEASASASASGDLKLAETSVTNKASGKTDSVASNLQVGGNLNMQTDGTLTVQGSNVAAGGNVKADANNIEMLAGRNESYSTSDTKSTSIGIYSDAGAGAGAKASQVGGAASASVSAEAKGTTTLGGRTEQATSSDYTLKNSASTITSGGNMALNAKEEAKFVGTDVKAGGDLSVTAKDITSQAAQDITTHSNAMSQTTAGLYVGANAGASASGDNTGGSASASAEVSAGLRHATADSAESSGSTTSKGASFTAGGNVTRTASGTISDQGTQIEAGGSIKQSASEIRDVAAADKTWASSTSSSTDARVGVYAGAEAGADSHTGSAGADASAGLKASVEGSTESSSESTSTAVTSRYKAGGSIDSSSSGKTTLEGTQFEAGKDVNLSAGSLDYQAAHDTASSSSSSLSGAAEVKVGIAGTAGVNGSAELDANKESASSSTARAGGISADGGVNVKTTGDASFEGTNLKGDSVAVAAGGNVDFKAAHDTSESSQTGVSASISAGTSGSGASRESEGSAGLGVTAGGSSSDTAKGSTVQAGAGGVSISAGNNAKLEGTQVKSGGDATVQAGGKVETAAAKSSSSSYGVSAGIAGGATSGEGESKGSGGAYVGAEGSSSRSSQAVSIQAAGKTAVASNAPVVAGPAKAKSEAAAKPAAKVAAKAALKAKKTTTAKAPVKAKSTTAKAAATKPVAKSPTDKVAAVN